MPVPLVLFYGMDEHINEKLWQNLIFWRFVEIGAFLWFWVGSLLCVNLFDPYI